MATIVTADLTFNSGKKAVSFYCIATEASVSGLIESADQSSMAVYLEYVQLSCSSMTGGPAIYDGSTGDSITGRIACGTGVFHSQEWDFRDDPMICLGGDTTNTICVSVASAGPYQGFIKYHWGPE